MKNKENRPAALQEWIDNELKTDREFWERMYASGTGIVKNTAKTILSKN